MSEWKKEAAKRRDERASKNDPCNKVAKGKKKDTKKWCRGKVGIEHQPVCYTYAEYKNDPDQYKIFKDWRVLACKICNKELKVYYAFGKEKNSPPNWVTK
jgi:hypothetical protein